MSSHAQLTEEPVPEVPEWIRNYNNLISRNTGDNEKPIGPSCFSICCTFFSIFGALFLFVLGGLMKSNYRYIHMAGDAPSLSKSVTYAGFMYLFIAAVSIFFWVKGSIAARNAAIANSTR